MDRPWHAEHIRPRLIEPRNPIPFKGLDPVVAQLKYRQQLKEDGYVIIQNVLCIDQCQEAIGLAHDYLETALAAEKALLATECVSSSDACTQPTTSAGVLRSCEDDNGCGDVDWPRVVEGGILPFYGAGSSSLCWFVRSQLNVRQVFANLLMGKYIDDSWDHRLLSSLEGMILWRKDQATDAGWFHIDQNPVKKPNHECIQGIVNLIPVDKTTGGNVIVEKSHVHFPQHYTEELEFDYMYSHRLEDVNGDDWLEIDSEDTKILDVTKIVCNKLGPGDMLLWDSRLVHCSFPSTHIDIDNDLDDDESLSVSRSSSDVRDTLLKRAAVLVTMSVVSSQEDEVTTVAKSRREAMARCQTLTHWIDKVSILASERPEEIEKEEKYVEWMRTHRPGVLLQYSELNEVQKKLVG